MTNKMTIDEATANNMVPEAQAERRVYANGLVQHAGEDGALEIAFWRNIMELLRSELNVEVGLMLNKRFGMPFPTTAELVDELHDAVNGI